MKEITTRSCPVSKLNPKILYLLEDAFTDEDDVLFCSENTYDADTIPYYSAYILTRRYLIKCFIPPEVGGMRTVLRLTNIERIEETEYKGFPRMVLYRIGEKYFDAMNLEFENKSTYQALLTRLRNLTAL